MVEEATMRLVGAGAPPVFSDISDDTNLLALQPLLMRITLLTCATYAKKTRLE